MHEDGKICISDINPIVGFKSEVRFFFTMNIFNGYFEELKNLLREKERRLNLKDRSICPLCECEISRKDNDNKLDEINEELEKLEIRKRRYNVKINETRLIN